MLFIYACKSVKLYNFKTYKYIQFVVSLIQRLLNLYKYISVGCWLLDVGCRSVNVRLVTDLNKQTNNFIQPTKFNFNTLFIHNFTRNLYFYKNNAHNFHSRFCYSYFTSQITKHILTYTHSKSIFICYQQLPTKLMNIL